MPEYEKVKKDRGYIHKKISRLLEIADERMRVVILLLASSGMRIGALQFPTMRNLEDLKITVYENEREEYLTFMTSECKKVL